MRRILMLMTVVALMTVMLAMIAGAASAQPEVVESCRGFFFSGGKAAVPPTCPLEVVPL